MSETIIKVENLSKQYRIGAKEGYKTFRETLIDSAKAPFLLCRDIAKKVISPLPSAGRSEPKSEENTIWALKDVSFEVKQGEVVGIIGRNGAGKSTLLKVLSKITEPTEGRVELRGRVGSLLEVGTGFHPELTGHENVYLYGAILGMDRWEVTRKFNEIIAFAELEKFVDTPVKRYSSGMYMRLAFAVAAHLEPEILLVDEVLAVGDAAFQKKCLGKMGDVSKEGRTVLFVSHNMGAIQKLCSRSFLLERGRIAIDNNTQQVVEAYLASREEEKFGMHALQDLPRRRGLGELIRITKCIILNSKNELTDLILFGEPFSVCIEAMANSDLRDLSVIVGIDSFTEYRITTVASEDNHIFFSASPTHPLRVQARLDTLSLKPGVYLITLAIRNRGTGLDHLPQILRLEVTEASEKDGKYDSGTWGVIHTLATWKDIEDTNDA